MKFFILMAFCLCVGVQALTEEQKNALKAYNEECSAISNATPDQIAKGRQGQFSDDPKLKVHVYCLSKKLGFQNEAGEIQEDVIRSKLGAAIGDATLTENLMKKCGIKKATPELTAFESFKCYKTISANVNII